MLKPDAVQRNLIGDIISRFETRGYKLVAAKMMKAPAKLLKEHYVDLAKKPFFPELVRYMSSGPVVPMIWEGLDAVKQIRAMLGQTNPRDSDPGSIRGDFCVDVGRNIIHASDSVSSANREIRMWFGQNEVAAWKPCSVSWIYEDEEEPQKSAKVDNNVKVIEFATPSTQNCVRSPESLPIVSAFFSIFMFCYQVNL